MSKIILREVLSWLWVILAFLFITGTIVQARVIPSGSMEKTLLVGDHLLMSRFGYDAEVPLTRFTCACGASRIASRWSCSARRFPGIPTTSSA